MAENNTPSKKTFAERAAAEPTDLHKQFADWLKEKTGVDVDLKTVQLVTVMRMDFQRSEENQTALKDRKAAAEKAKTEANAKRLAKLRAELAKLEGGTDETKPEEPDEAPKADAEPTGEAQAENAPETATEGSEEPKAEEAPKPARKPRVRRTATTK